MTPSLNEDNMNKAIIIKEYSNKFVCLLNLGENLFVNSSLLDTK